MTVTYRVASYHDYASIAHIHAINWKQNYQEVLDANYLKNEVDRDRLEVWQNRLGLPKSNQYIVVAVDDEEVIGFVCTYINYDGTHGHYIDNLHVLREYQGHGIGRQLVHYSVNHIVAISLNFNLFLWVFENNHSAIRSYKYWGAQAGNTEYLNMPSGGGGGMTTRMIWEDCRSLLISDSPSLSNEKYIPVDCNLYDYLEIAAMRSIDVEIQFNDHHKSLTDRITTLKSVNKIEYLITKTGYSIGLDRIKKVMDTKGGLIVDFSAGVGCNL